MKVVKLQERELYSLLDAKHNPPNVQDQKDENQFQTEIRALYNQLIECLAPFGEEDDYGDYSVGPDLKVRPTVMGFAPHRREFVIDVLTQDLFTVITSGRFIRFCLRAPLHTELLFISMLTRSGCRF